MAEHYPFSKGRPDGIQIAVVGHTNAGKTSLLRTLTRRASFGEVADRPGTTRHVERIALRIDGGTPVTFFDTPGLEDSTALLDHLRSHGQDLARLERVEAFLAGPEARRSFEQEAKVLRKMLEVDAALYVIDCREPVLPKFRCEIEILASCARPVMPVLNFVRHPASREAEWQAVLQDSGLHAQVRFDAVAPFVGSEQRLYQDLATLLPRQREALAGVVLHLDREAAERRAAGCRLIADLLVDLAAMRRPVEPEAHADPLQRQRLVADLQADALARVRRCMDGLLAVHGFRRDDAEMAAWSEGDTGAAWLDGRWQDDLFNPESLKQAGKRLGQGAAIGASLGLIADLAVAGMSLGAGAVVGGAVGGIVTQGWRQFGNRLVNKLRGVQELTLANELLLLAAAHLIDVLRALAERGHAASQKLRVPGRKGAVSDAALRQLVTLAQPARSHPLWQRDAGEGSERGGSFGSFGVFGSGESNGGPASRRALVESLAQRIAEVAAVVEAAEPAGAGAARLTQERETPDGR
ncbi:MAG: GTP-binding protein [Rhodoferax sp.]|nr:GTP-binding protein [Rhodoferax sp.]